MSDNLGGKDSYFSGVRFCGENQENSSSSRSTGGKKRKSVAEGKEKIRHRKQGTLCIDESSNSKQPEKIETYKDRINEKNVWESAKLLIDRLNKRKTSAGDLQNQVRNIHEQTDALSPLHAKNKKLEDDLGKMDKEIEDVRKEISDVLADCRLTVDEAKQKFIEIEKKFPKFIEGLQNGRTELKEINKELEKRKEELEMGGKCTKELNQLSQAGASLATCFAAIVEKLTPEQCKELQPHVSRMRQVIGVGAHNLPICTQVAGGQQIQSLDEKIQSLAKKIQPLDKEIARLEDLVKAREAKREDLVEMRGYQLAQGQIQKGESLDEIAELGREIVDLRAEIYKRVEKRAVLLSRYEDLAFEDLCM